MQILAVSKEKEFLKIGTSNTDYQWYTVTDTVAEYAKSLKKGDIVEIKYEKKSDNKLYLTFIKKTGETVAKSEFKCKDCGASLKDDTYKTCYTCSMKAKKDAEGTPEEMDKQASIKRQAIGHMTSRTLIALQGQVTEANVEALIDKLYDKYVKKVG